MTQTPVCDMCRLTPIKCVICENKLKNGELTEADFDISRGISSSKSDMELEKAFDLGKCYVGVFKGAVNPKLKEYLGRDLIQVKSGQDLLNKLNLKVRPSRVFVAGEEKQRVALNKTQLDSMEIKPCEFLRK